MVDDPTFPYRVAFGLLIFGALGTIDLVRTPRNPKRLKEYAFLFGVTGAAMLYGLLHDAVTFSLSPGYFRVVKGVRVDSFFPEVAKLALMAAWTAGLAIGLVMLVANNPSKRLSQLPYPRLSRHLIWPLVGSPLVAIALGLAAWLGPQAWVHVLAVDEVADSHRNEIATVWVIHIGTYVGALVGLALAVFRIRSERRRLPVP